MPIELKNALAAWKKAKPLTLTKTGVSEVLRTLPQDPSVVKDFRKEIPIFENVKKVLEVAVANKHIAASKGAHECVKQILDAVKLRLSKMNEQRTTLNKSLKTIFDGGHAMVKAPAKGTYETMKAALKDYNNHSGNFHPANIEYIQVPTRVVLIAGNYLQAKEKHQAKQIEGSQKEFTEYMKRYASMGL